MLYTNVEKATFLQRPNRFISNCLLNGQQVSAHIKNTGRCKELLVPGCTVYLETANNPARKTRHTLFAVEKGPHFINIDSSAPNKVAAEALASGELPFYGERATLIKPEAAFLHSRFDFYIETKNFKGYMEVKGCTLEENGVCRFPDAPTLRGQKHVEELTALAKSGVAAAVLFVVQMEKALYFTPNNATHPAFGAALIAAKAAGVQVLAHTCAAGPGMLALGPALPVRL